MTFRLILILALLYAPFLARAEAPERAPMPFLGAEGLWLRLDVANRVLADLERCKQAETLPALYERKIKLLDEELRLAQRLRGLAEQGEERAVASLDAAIEQKQLAEQARDAWWRQPALWFAGGLLLGVASVAIAVQQ